MSRHFIALMWFATLASLAVGGRAAEPSRVQFVSRDPEGTESDAPSKRVQAPLAATAPEAAEPIARPEGPERETEEVIERYSNGNVKIKRHVTQDAQRNYINHGAWMLYDIEGNAIAIGHYQMGKRDGAWSRLQSKASKNFEGAAFKGFTQPFVWESRFSDDLLNGKWTMLDAEGRQIRTWEFEQGRLHGKSVDWYADGKKRRELHFVQGVPQGELREWDDTGKVVMSLNYRDGRPHRAFIEKHPTGGRKLEGWYLGAQEQVRVMFNWWEGTMRVDLVEVEGKDVRHGTWAGWHSDGGKQYQGEYENDKPVGVHTWWYPNGQKQISGHFGGGQETGRWTWWHDNGFKALEGDFVDGQKDGKWTAWHSNGRKSQAGAYAADKKTGQWAIWDDTGKFVEWRDYSADPERAGEGPQVTKPVAPEASRKPTAGAGPLSQKPKQPVPEILQRWLDRNGQKTR